MKMIIDRLTRMVEEGKFSYSLEKYGNLDIMKITDSDGKRTFILVRGDKQQVLAYVIEKLLQLKPTSVVIDVEGDEDGFAIIEMLNKI